MKLKKENPDLTLNTASFEKLVDKQKTLLKIPTEVEKSLCANVFYINENNTNEIIGKLAKISYQENYPTEL